MDKSRERARRLTIASAIIATIMILATKTSTVNYLAYYVGHEYFKATCIFSSLVVIETTIIMHIVAAALGDIVATRHNGATEERNISDYVWMASICVTVGMMLSSIPQRRRKARMARSQPQVSTAVKRLFLTCSLSIKRPKGRRVSRRKRRSARRNARERLRERSSQAPPL